jgi:CrcB protein
MTGYLAIALGGALGSVVRYLIGKRISEVSRSRIPMGTGLVNLTGAILLGVLTALDFDGNLYALVGDGFLGAYTTFSTFMYEGFQLFQNREKLNAIVYIAGTIILGVLGFLAGLNIGGLCL